MCTVGSGFRAGLVHQFQLARHPGHCLSVSALGCDANGLISKTQTSVYPDAHLLGLYGPRPPPWADMCTSCTRCAQCPRTAHRFVGMCTAFENCAQCPQTVSPGRVIRVLDLTCNRLCRPNLVPRGFASGAVMRCVVDVHLPPPRGCCRRRAVRHGLQRKWPTWGRRAPATALSSRRDRPERQTRQFRGGGALFHGLHRRYVARVWRSVRDPPARTGWWGNVWGRASGRARQATTVCTGVGGRRGGGCGRRTHEAPKEWDSGRHSDR